MKNDFLKHWRVARYYIKRKYKITQSDLEILLFLYSEGRFTKKIFKDYSSVFEWEHQRFKRLQNEGWIVVWRKQHGRSHSVYELSHKAKTLVNRLYKILNGEEKIPMSSKRNPLFQKRVGFNDKVYREVIKDINNQRW